MKGVALLLLALLLAGTALVRPASAPGPLAADIGGPSAVVPKSVAGYTLTAVGGPGEGGGNYSVEYYLEGDHLTGASPQAASPGHEQKNSGTFHLNVTVPAEETVFDLVVTVTSIDPTTNESASTIRRATIASKAPVYLVATFENTGTVAAVGVAVDFFVDGARVGSETIARIDPGQKGTANHTWVPVGVADGSHSVRAEADLNGDGVIDPGTGEVSSSSVFVRRPPGLSTGATILIITAILMLGLLVVLAYRRRLKAEG